MMTAKEVVSAACWSSTTMPSSPNCSRSRWTTWPSSTASGPRPRPPRHRGWSPGTGRTSSSSTCMLGDEDGMDLVTGCGPAAPHLVLVVVSAQSDAGTVASVAAAGAQRVRAQERGVRRDGHGAAPGPAGSVYVPRPCWRRRSGPGDGRSRPLTGRESDVLSLMGHGASPTEIARILNISSDTCRGLHQRRAPQARGQHAGGGRRQGPADRPDRAVAWALSGPPARPRSGAVTALVATAALAFVVVGAAGYVAADRIARGDALAETVRTADGVGRPWRTELSAAVQGDPAAPAPTSTRPRSRPGAATGR